MGSPSPKTVSTKLQQIAELARKSPEMVITTLAHHIDVEFLREAYRQTRKKRTVGVDGQTAADYARNLDENLRSLLNRLKSGTYKAPPVRRAYIPKRDGEKRPIGVPTFEDKILQRAVMMVLEAVYEQDFYDCSYGFRPGRNSHQAMHTLWKGLMSIQGGYVLEVDIKTYFDTIDKKELRKFLDQRVRDGVIRKMIDKWMKAGVLEEGKIKLSETGTPQGAVISPLLSNIYLHKVLDEWFERVVKPLLSGKAIIARFADDFVIVFEHKKDAERVMAVLPKRFEKYGLELHPKKTGIIPFEKPDKLAVKAHKPKSFVFLGFNFHWEKSRKGEWVVRQTTAKDRLCGALKKINQWCRKYRHSEISWQHRQLSAKLRGHYNYFGVIGNVRALLSFRHKVLRIWHKWLNRRSQRNKMNWVNFGKLLKQYPIPIPKMMEMPYRHVVKLLS